MKVRVAHKLMKGVAVMRRFVLHYFWTTDWMLLESALDRGAHCHLPLHFAGGAGPGL